MMGSKTWKFLEALDLKGASCQILRFWGKTELNQNVGSNLVLQSVNYDKKFNFLNKKIFEN